MCGPIGSSLFTCVYKPNIKGSKSSPDAEDAIISYINDLEPTDSLRVSLIEKQLHTKKVSIYNHPVFVYCLTYDLNRDIILTRSDNLIDDTTILHDGTNRITYFIAKEGNILVGGSF